MKTAKQLFEMCTKLRVDPAKVKISKEESQKLERQIKDIAFKQSMNGEEPD